MNTSEFDVSRNLSHHGVISHETAFTIFSLIEITTGSLFNGFVILVLLFYHRLRQIPANVVLLSLVVSDFFACSVVLPYHLYEILHARETIVHQAFLLFSMTLGMLGTVLLTVDRFLAIILPLRYRLLVTTTRTRFILILKWLISFAHSTMFYIAMQCQVKGLRYLLSLVKFGSLLVIFVLYGVIFRAALRQIKRIQKRNKALRRAGFVVFKRTLKSAKTSGSVVFFFAVTYLPVFIQSAFNESRSVPLSIFNERTAWLLALAFLNCCVNPILYCAFSETLRAVIRKTLRRAHCILRGSPSDRNPRSQRSLSASSCQQSAKTSIVEMPSSVSVFSLTKIV